MTKTDMSQLDVCSYRRVNEGFRRRMVYRVGIDCGFFVEMNYMLNAMLYCLSHGIRFQLYSEKANYGTGVGWTEYFLPFCEEVHEPFHNKYNFHHLPSWAGILKLCKSQKRLGPVVWKLKCTVKSVVGHVLAFKEYKQRVLLAQDVSARHEEHYCIPALDIDGCYTDAYGALARMIWNLHPDIMSQETEFARSSELPHIFDGIHVRGGDKSSETDLLSGEYVMKVLNPKKGNCVFVLTDDYRQFRTLQTLYPHLRLVTLCQENETGYHHKEFCKQTSQEKKQAVIRLIASVDILLRSRSFVGSITTGPSVFVMKLRADDSLVKAADCPRADMVKSLCLPIPVRAEISRKHVASATM